jgi:hypothetical protein
VNLLAAATHRVVLRILLFEGADDPIPSYAQVSCCPPQMTVLLEVLEGHRRPGSVVIFQLVHLAEEAFDLRIEYAMYDFGGGH